MPESFATAQWSYTEEATKTNVFRLSLASQQRICHGCRLKKPSKYLKLRQLRLARKGADHRRRRKGKQRASEQNRYISPGWEISAPVKFDVTLKSGIQLAKFLRAVAHTVLKDRKPVKLDFRFTEAFYAAGTILLFAEIDRIVATSDLVKPVTLRLPRLRKPREVMKQIGICEITGDQCNIIPEREDVIYWKATKGFDQSGDKLAMLEVVAARVNKVHANKLELTDAWRGVSEAVANSVEHAYKISRQDGFNGLASTRWWMFTQLRGDYFSMAVCDLGCGYKATVGLTLPEQFLSAFYKMVGGQNEDARAIDAAMEYGRSGTRQSERGKGSRDAMSVLEKHGSGDLFIVSNTGWARYSYFNGKMTKEFGEVGVSIQGTIIWWKLPLKDG